MGDFPFTTVMMSDSVFMEDVWLAALETEGLYPQISTAEEVTI